MGLKFSTSKAILKIYRREGRIGKKMTRNKRPSPKKMLVSKETIHNLKKEESEIFMMFIRDSKIIHFVFEKYFF